MMDYNSMLWSSVNDSMMMGDRKVLQNTTALIGLGLEQRSSTTAETDWPEHKLGKKHKEGWNL